MSHLEHLEIKVKETQFGWRHSQTIEGIVRKNAQIESATFLGFPDDWIKTVEQFLPNVITLKINKFSTFEEFIHLNNVKNFTLDTFEPDHIDVFAARLRFRSSRQLK